jgi:hypothetical protein
MALFEASQSDHAFIDQAIEIDHSSTVVAAEQHD